MLCVIGFFVCSLGINSLRLCFIPWIHLSPLRRPPPRLLFTKSLIASSIWSSPVMCPKTIAMNIVLDVSMKVVKIIVRYSKGSKNVRGLAVSSMRSVVIYHLRRIFLGRRQKRRGTPPPPRVRKTWL